MVARFTFVWFTQVTHELRRGLRSLKLVFIVLLTLTLILIITINHQKLLQKLLLLKWIKIRMTTVYNTIQCNIIQYRSDGPSTYLFNVEHHKIVKYSKIQHSTVLYSTVQYRTVQNSTV